MRRQHKLQPNFLAQTSIQKVYSLSQLTENQLILYPMNRWLDSGVGFGLLDDTIGKGILSLTKLELNLNQPGVAIPINQTNRLDNFIYNYQVADPIWFNKINFMLAIKAFTVAATVTLNAVTIKIDIVKGDGRVISLVNQPYTTALALSTNLVVGFVDDTVKTGVIAAGDKIRLTITTDITSNGTGTVSALALQASPVAASSAMSSRIAFNAYNHWQSGDFAVTSRKIQ